MTVSVPHQRTSIAADMARPRTHVRQISDITVQVFVPTRTVKRTEPSTRRSTKIGEIPVRVAAAAPQAKPHAGKSPHEERLPA